MCEFELAYAESGVSPSSTRSPVKSAHLGGDSRFRFAMHQLSALEDVQATPKGGALDGVPTRLALADHSSFFESAGHPSRLLLPPGQQVLVSDWYVHKGTAVGRRRKTHAAGSQPPRDRSPQNLPANFSAQAMKKMKVHQALFDKYLQRKPHHLATSFYDRRATLTPPNEV